MSKPVVASLMKRFPNSNEEDVQAALLAADGHGGKAASILMSRPVEAAPKLALAPEQAEDLARVKAEFEQEAAEQHRKDLLKAQDRKDLLRSLWCLNGYDVNRISIDGWVV